MTEQQQRELARGLRALADSTRDFKVSPHIEAAVLAKMGSASAEAAARPTSRRLLPLAAALLLAVGGALYLARTAPVTHVVQAAGFVALPGAAVLPDMESANIVRVSLPVAALPAYGFAIADFRTESVEAELLVAQDGQARAIRFVNDSD